MASEEDIQNQQKRLVISRGNLAHYLSQRGLHGAAYVPLVVNNGIKEERENIAHIKATLRGWGVEAEDHPNDIETYIAPVDKHIDSRNHPIRYWVALGVAVLAFMFIIASISAGVDLAGFIGRAPEPTQVFSAPTVLVKSEFTAVPTVEPISTAASEVRAAPTIAPFIEPTIEPIPTSVASATPMITATTILAVADLAKTPNPDVALDAPCKAPVPQRIEYPSDGQIPTLESGVEYTGLIFPGESQIYRFTAERGSTVTFSMNQGPGVRSWLHIYDEAGNFIQGSSSAHPDWVQMGFFPRSSAVYLLHVVYWGGQGDDYAVRLIGSTDIAKLALGVKCPGEIAGNPFAEYIFEGEAGSAVLLTYEQGPGLKAWLKVYDMDRNELVSSSSAHPPVVTLSFTPPASSSYIVRIEIWEGSGDYKLSIDAPTS